MSWQITYYSEALQEVILALPAGIQARYVHITQRMLIVGPDLGMPHTRALGKGLFEIRAKAEEGIGRVFYCTLVGERIVMLHTFVKKTQVMPDKELRIARRRMKEIKDAES
jgi:phage-related protein